MINWTEYTDVWPKVKRAARTTISKEGEGAYPTDSWKKTILLAEHSPIRKIKFSWKWYGLRYWVSVHFTRHFQGILHWVSTQRTDRTGVDRGVKDQSSPVDHECEANAQALINISRRRLCGQASPETREAWREVKAEVEKVDPVLASVMVPECIYRGFCPEWEANCCGYVDTESYRNALAAYRNKEV